MTDYIIPQFRKYEQIDDLLSNDSKHRSVFKEDEYISIDNLLSEGFVCIVGEPGVGKSRLVDELKKPIPEETYFSCSASVFNEKSVSEDVEYCFIDALDEVEQAKFYNTLRSIKQYKENFQKVKVFFSCRKHYVASFDKHFGAIDNLVYVELCRLNDTDVKSVIDVCSEITKASIDKSPKLKELLSIPRYLTFLLEYEKQRGGCSNISELFEFIIDRSIDNAIEKYSDISNTVSTKIIVQRALEKIAFVMEIARKDQISKDELYTILDSIKGNMTQMLLANFDLLFFESRILKDTNGTLQFENTELQEYLAAKELCRQDNIESILYDIAAQKDLKHIYPNWYDVIPHITYSEDKIDTFVNIIKLIVSYESNLESNAFDSLLRYVDASVLTVHQREELFTILFEHYLREPVYIRWNNQILNLMQGCYSLNCDTKLKIHKAEQLNVIQLSNIAAVLEEISDNGKLSNEVFDCWETVANTLMNDTNMDKQRVALQLFDSIKDDDSLISLSTKYDGFDKNIQEKYCETTGYRRIADTHVVNCWLHSCYVRNPYAINAVLCIVDPEAITYAYRKIIEDGKTQEFFNPLGSLLVHYELYLTRQFEIAWNNNSDGKNVMTRLMADYMRIRYYRDNKDIKANIKKILLNKDSGTVFVNCFDKEWNLENVFQHFDAELVDAELITATELLLAETNVEQSYIDYILTILTNKVRKDDSKKDSVRKYIERYAETFDRWDKDSQKNKDKQQTDPSYYEAYDSLSDDKKPMNAKYQYAFRLCNDMDFLKKQNPQPFVHVVTAFFSEIDLDEMSVEKKDAHSFNLSTALAKIPMFVKALYDLNFKTELDAFRILLAKTLPMICCATSNIKEGIKEAYKCAIGNISDEEKDTLVEWWKSRQDDFLSISPDNIFDCITDYGIDALDYKLEEYVDEYIREPNLDHTYAAFQALGLISEGHCGWSIECYRTIFESLDDDTIDSLKMQCNGILIEKFHDKEAITWRINYLRGHTVKLDNDDSGEIRIIPPIESEISSSNPRLFRCFANIKDDVDLNNQMLDLFDFALSLWDKPDLHDYASYLLRGVSNFFITINAIVYIKNLREMVDKANSIYRSYVLNNIMVNAEMAIMTNQKAEISQSIKMYNRFIEESHLPIRNDADLRRYFSLIQLEVQREIEDNGIYSLVRQENLTEDFIQRELKNTIINKCCQMGLEECHVDREVALQDNKRTDLLIRYGLCNPIMIEIKLLHNNEIKRKTERQAYKKKFVQYMSATNACLAVFWVFDVHKDNGAKNFEDLKKGYSDLHNTVVLLTDCKCRSGYETGLPKKKRASSTKIDAK